MNFDVLVSKNVISELFQTPFSQIKANNKILKQLKQIWNSIGCVATTDSVETKRRVRSILVFVL